MMNSFAIYERIISLRDKYQNTDCPNLDIKVEVLSQLFKVAFHNNDSLPRLLNLEFSGLILHFSDIIESETLEILKALGYNDSFLVNPPILTMRDTTLFPFCCK